MSLKSLSLACAALVTFAFVGVMAAQAPLHEKVVVNLSYPVHVDGKVLPPGSYTISEQNRPVGAPGLLIEGKNGNNNAISLASTVKIEQKPAATQTKVVLRQVGNNYYFDKIWIKGRTYGWQVPLPDGVSNQQGQTVEIPGNYQAGQQGQSSANPPVQNEPMTIPQASHAQ